MDSLYLDRQFELNPNSTIAHIFDNTVATYKFYWFVSLLDIVVKEGKDRVTFWEIIAGMLSESWYPIHYFKLSFGKSDSIYQQSLELQKYLNIPIDFDKNDIKSAIVNSINDPATIKLLRVFTKNVPYRFLSPWINEPVDTKMEMRSRSFENNCLYAIFDKEIQINPIWKSYLVEQYTMLRDFTFWNLNLFLQKRNPNVPDLPSKLIKPIQRESLTNQRRLWNMYINNNEGLLCIYTHTRIRKENYDLDHFIPWSFVAHNQLWDLIPANPSVNSSKSNLLPPLDVFVKPYADIQHSFLKYIYEIKPNERLLEDYLQISDSIPELVYLSDDDFALALRKVFMPLEQIASNMGFVYMNRL